MQSRLRRSRYLPIQCFRSTFVPYGYKLRIATRFPEPSFIDRAVRMCFFMRARIHFSLTPIGRECRGVLSRFQLPTGYANLT